MKRSIFILFLNLFLVLIAVCQEVPVYRGLSDEIIKLLPDNLPNPSKMDPHYSFSLSRPEIPKESHPSLFGIPVAVSYKVRNPGQLSSWTVQVESNDALNLDLSFTDVSLSEISKIYIFNNDGSNVLGPIDVRSINTKLKSFSSIPMIGNRIFRECLNFENGYQLISL